MIWIIVFACIFCILLVFLNRFFEVQSKTKFKRNKVNINHESNSDSVSYKQSGYTSPSSWKKSQKDHKLISKVFNQGDLMYSQNQFDKAEKCFIEVLAMDPEHQFANNKLGLIYLKKNQNIKAEAIFLKLIEIDHKNATYYSNLALSFYNQGKLKEAYESYKVSVKLNPKENRYLSLGQVCMDLNNYKEAANAFSKALELNPKNTELYFFIADILLKIGAIDEAKAYINTYLDEKPYSNRAKEKLREIKIAGNESPLN